MLMAVLVAALVGVALLALVAVQVGRLRSAVDETGRQLRELSDRSPTARPEPLAPSALVSAAAQPGPGPLDSPGAPSAALNATLGVVVVKSAAFGYGLSRALSQESRDHVGHVVATELRARRRGRLADARRAQRDGRRR